MRYGQTCLHFALCDPREKGGAEETKKIIKLLLQYGTNVNATTQGGWAAAHRAAMNGYDQSLRLSSFWCSNWQYFVSFFV